MNYRHVYMLIIEHAKKESELGLRPKNSYQRKNFPNQYFEFHHILPKSLFPLWSKRKSNIVPLTAREHFFCHQLLTKIYTDSRLIFALWRLCNGTDIQKVYSSKYYEHARKRISKIQALNNLGENNPNYGNHALAGKNNPMYGKNIKDYMSEEAYNKWKNHLKNIQKTEESIKKWKESYAKMMETKGRFEDDETKKVHFKKMVETRKKSGSYKKTRETIEKLSKKVLCVEDNRVFSSQTECEKFYNIKHLGYNIDRYNGYYKNIDKHFVRI